MAAYVFYAQSEEEQKSIVDSFGAKGISGQGVAHHRIYSNADTSATTNIQTSSSFTQSVTGFTTPPGKGLPEASGMVQYALDFSQYTPTSPAVISFSTQGYEAAGMRPRLAFDVAKPSAFHGYPLPR